MSQEKTVFTEEEFYNMVQNVDDNYISELLSTPDEELIIRYAKAVSRNDPEYFERPAKELILEWALKYIDTTVRYGKKL